MIAMATSFSSRTTAVAAALGLLLAARAVQAQSPAPAPAPQPYPGAWAPYAAPPQAYPPPQWGAAMPFATERNSTGMIAGGITLITIGSVGSIIGAALLASGTAANDDWICSDFECFPTSPSTNGRTVGGAVMVGVSMAALVAGIPLLAVGMRKVPARPETVLVPAVRLGVGGGSLRWQF